MINGVIKTVYEDRNNTIATFPVTVTGAVYTSEGDLIEEIFDKDTFATVNVPTSGWTTNSEGVATISISLTGAKAGKHPICSCQISSKAVMESELEAFGAIMSIVEVDGALNITSASVPAVAFTLQVKNY